MVCWPAQLGLSLLHGNCLFCHAAVPDCLCCVHTCVQVGTDYLPAGWELAYNHFSNRLGLAMPETSALLRRAWPEWYELYFGLATLTHGASAANLWVPGLKAGFREC